MPSGSHAISDRIAALLAEAVELRREESIVRERRRVRAVAKAYASAREGQRWDTLRELRRIARGA